MPTSSAQQEQVRQHRRETWLYMIVPLAVTIFLVLLGIVVVLLLQRQLQVSLLADWMLTIMLLCPALLCTTVICILLFAAIALMSRAQRAAAQPLQRLQEVTNQVAERTTKAADSVNEVAINAASRFAFLDRLFNIFDAPSEDKKADHHD